ncbi:hypothetical protein DU478_01845 [Thalassococcus profundi]|uniref:B12-binding domain-containing protein n=1 Tax=Thalassococcus profundi TaxID=2282382 RepID=A0A369TZ39_9RHOB|nr:cobalamin-dependent protein [Thalassococcus profundi]RDD68236.1 hypothetical protein DU478_01845 [Thalassococcus profundi]
MDSDPPFHGRAPHHERERPDISVLATTVLSVLGDKGDQGCRQVRSSMVDALIDATLAPGQFDGKLVLDALARGRLGAEEIVDIYIPEAARRMGAMWVADDLSFARVTIGSARLQGLLALLAAPWSAGTSGTRSRIEALLVLQGDDAHTLGPHVAASQMRRLGVGVRILFNQDAKIVLRMLQEDCFDLILFSTSRTEALAPIAQMVKRMRAELSRVPPVVLGGLVQDLAEKVQERTGVDLVTTDVRAALRLCEREKQKTRSLAG